MKELIEKIEQFSLRIQEVWKLLRLDEKDTILSILQKEMSEPSFWNDPEHARAISQKVDTVQKELETWKNIQNEIKDLLDVAIDSFDQKDESLKEEIEKKFFELQKRFQELEFFVLFSGKYDENSAIVAVHAGSGGVDAQDWAEMLLRMLIRFCEKRDFSVRILDESRGQEAGIKSVTCEVLGSYAYGWLRSEHGVHRLVRISPFDAEAMRHTSFSLVEVLPIVEHMKEAEIKDEEVKIDVFRSSGHGGQSVNTTDSAVRITHIPTGIVVTCQNERSQHANKKTAFRILQAKLELLHEEKLRKEHEKLRGEYKEAEWGNQIRSYVLHPYKMVKDLRTRYETADTESVLDGNLESLVEAYLRWDREKQS